jgi:putative membrane protein
MSSVGQAALLSWSVPPAASFALALTALIYLRGWFLMRRARVPFVPAWRCVCFLLGLLTVWTALASPLDTFSSFIITLHMLQHMLLMMLAPPLLLLGAPLIPLVRGLPVFAAREFAGPFLNWRPPKRIGDALTNLFVALVLMGAVTFAWHTPRLYELALASAPWHEVEHACFFVVSLIFWWPVVQPWPSQANAPGWALIPYLLVADLENTVLSAILMFSDRVLYPSYAAMPRLFGFSALHDQAAAGATMWVLGSVAFLIPAVIITVEWLSRPSSELRKLRMAAAMVSTRSVVAGRHELPVARFLRGKFSSTKVEALTFVVLFVATGVVLAVLSSVRDDDDQVLRMRQTSGALTVSVFAPRELQSGVNNIAVLVQDSKTQDVLPEATVDLRAQSQQDASESNPVRANAGDSENKLLQSADVDLPIPGDWNLSIVVHQGAAAAEFTLPLAVAKPDEGLPLPWSYVLLMVFASVLLFTYCWRHRTGATRARPAEAAALSAKVDSAV